MGFPRDVSADGHLIDGVFYLATYLTTGAFLLVVGILAYSLIFFRARPGHRAFYTRGDSRKALIFTLIFAALVFLVLDVNLAYYDYHAFEGVFGHPPERSEAVVVRVQAEQYAWHFHYAGADEEWGRTDPALISAENPVGLDDSDPIGEDDIVVAGAMAVPLNQPVIVDLSSKDVIHSFFLPNLRVKQDVLPGMTTSLYFTATQTGDYDIACAELCGLGHYTMRGLLKVMNQADYEAWLVSQTADEFFDEDELD